MVLTIVLAVLAAWVLVSVLLALVIGRAVKLADTDRRRRMAYRATSAPARTAARIAS
ncbi:hypothetical protein [Amnibacterium setariae]|uniref:hypothetical protein n=1 Tax=Amnibacterium setariae TaxID=2306585 RepID=UPI0013149986|nr:hypothetical protein [Amnibacterium setariae]